MNPSAPQRRLTKAAQEGNENRKLGFWVFLSSEFLIFAGMIGSTRALLAERDNGCICALILSPLDRGALYVAKLVAAFIFMAIAEAAAVVLMVLFFNL